MNKRAKKHLEIALGGNMHTSSLTTLAIEEIMTDFAKKEVEAINYTRCCTELKTVKQGENLILDNKFDVEVVTPESSVLIKHKDKDRLIWVDKQRLKRN